MEDPIPLETAENRRKTGRVPRATGVLVAVLVAAAIGSYLWYYLQSSCGVNNVRAATSALNGQVNVYADAYQMASLSAPAAMMSPVTQMQQILMDTKEVAVPACLQTAKTELVTSMEDGIRAFLAFMEQEPEVEVQRLIEKSSTHLDNFTTELEAVNRCAPLCR